MDKNDTKLTAWVLGELPEAEAVELQKLVENDPELREEVEQIRKTVAEIEQVMREEPLPEISVNSVPAVKTSEPPRKTARVLLFGGTICAAAVLTFCLMMPGFWNDSAPELAHAPNSAVGNSAPVAPEAHVDNDKKRGRIARPGVADQFGLPDGEPETASDSRQRLEYSGIFDGDNNGKPIEIEFAEKDSSVISMADDLQNSMPTLFQENVTKSTDTQGLERRDKKAGLAHDIPREVTEIRKVDKEKIEKTVTEYSESIKKPSGTPVIASLEAKGGKSTENVYGVRGALGRPEGGENVELGMMVTPRIIIQEEEEEYILPVDNYDSANTAEFEGLPENLFLKPLKAPFSTFSIDVDTASYSFMRRSLKESRKLPPQDSVRIEEYVNYFSYDYPAPEDGKPFATYIELGACPWNEETILAKIGIKGKEFSEEERPALNLVFLLDVSGSMAGSNRLPLVKRGLTELVEMLKPEDRIAIVTYAGSSNVALQSVSGSERQAILDTINSLNASGATAGGEGIQSAYSIAKKNFRKDGQNRIILCTDGDFNIGISDNTELEKLITEEAKSGVFLSVLGFGMGNFKDSKLKTLSSKGNGNYGYIDSIEEARKMLVEDLTGTLITIAKDVKIQIDFNPEKVAAYRLIGYEKRKLQDRDFNDDTKDAGEIGAGHTVTALYEIVPVGKEIPVGNRRPLVDRSRYAKDVPEETESENVPASDQKYNDELMLVKLRYKQPDGDKSELLEYPVVYKADEIPEMSKDFRFAAAVALFGMHLRGSAFTGTSNLDTVDELVRDAISGPNEKYRKEFLELLGIAKQL